MRDTPTMHWPPGDWFLDYSSPGDLAAYRKSEVLISGKTRFQEYEIFTSPFWGKVLLLDGRLQSRAKG